MEAERRSSIWIDAWNQLQALRCVRLLRLGRYAEPEDKAIAEYSAQLKRITGTLLALAQSSEGEQAGAVMLELAWEEYLRNEWAQGLTPAFPLAGFCHSAVLERCWVEAEKRIAEEAELRRFEVKR